MFIAAVNYLHYVGYVYIYIHLYLDNRPQWVSM